MYLQLALAGDALPIDLWLNTYYAASVDCYAVAA
jgi:hypothetical protein